MNHFISQSPKNNKLKNRKTETNNMDNISNNIF